MAAMALRDAAVAVVRRLREHGYTAYFAGGCVRDMLLGREPKDYDVATDAPPGRIVELFTRTRKIGIQFGVVLVKQRHFWIEVATFRTDLSYSDGRHPDGIRFSTPEEDAQRRDFTINGMFYDPIAENIIDFVGGQADLDARILRAIGEARHRFGEDHLRVLRAVRFAAAYGCRIDPATWEAIREMAPAIRTVSAERIREELEKSFARPARAVAFRLMADAGLLGYLWEGASWTAADVEGAWGLLSRLPDDACFESCLAAILRGRPVPEIHQICRKLTCSNRTREAAAWLAGNAETLDDPSRLTLADLKLLMQSPWFEHLRVQYRAVCETEGRSLAAYEEINRRAAALSPEEVRPQPFVSGDDLKAMGVPVGPAYSNILDRVYYAQLNGELRTRGDATRMAEEMARQLPADRR